MEENFPDFSALTKTESSDFEPAKSPQIDIAPCGATRDYDSMTDR
jgi:hypothetical protein